MILVFTFPMFIFTIFAGIVASYFAVKKYNVNEGIKRTIMLSVAFVFALVLSALLYYL